MSPLDAERSAPRRTDRPNAFSSTAYHSDRRKPTAALGVFPIYVYPRSQWPKWYRAPWETDERCSCSDEAGA